LNLVIWFTAFGNLLVCVAVYKVKKLQTSTNLFLISLAIADFMVSLFVMPTSLMVEILNYYPFGSKMCTIWIVLDVLCCTSSIHHMSTMALDRYLTIRFPLKYGRNKSRRVALIKIFIIWFISICLCSPLLILGFIDESNVFDLNTKQCVLFNKSYKFYGSIFAFYIPFIIMLIAYVKTIRILKLILNKKRNVINESIKEKPDHKYSILDKNSSSKLNKLSKSTSNIDYKEFLQSDNEQKSKSLINIGSISFRKEITIAQIKEKANSLNISYKNFDYKFEFSSIKHAKSILNLDKMNIFNSYTIDKIRGKTKSSSLCIQLPNKFYSKDLNKKISNSNHDVSNNDLNEPIFKANNINIKQNNTLSLSSYQKIKNVANNERKALKVLIIMFTVFVTLWSPFFILNTLSAIFDDFTKLIFSKYEPIVYSLLTWLGYISSMANPIVYTMFNKSFRNAFLNIVSCNQNFSKYYSNNQKLRHKNHNYNFKKNQKFEIYSRNQTSFSNQLKTII
jgi:hypothetical protein